MFADTWLSWLMVQDYCYTSDWNREILVGQMTDETSQAENRKIIRLIHYIAFQTVDDGGIMLIYFIAWLILIPDNQIRQKISGKVSGKKKQLMVHAMSAVQPANIVRCPA